MCVTVCSVCVSLCVVCVCVTVCSVCVCVCECVCVCVTVCSVLHIRICLRYLLVFPARSQKSNTIKDVLYHN